MKYKKEKNRLLAFILCFVLLFSNLSSSSFVTDAIAETADHEHEFQILADESNDVISDVSSNDVTAPITNKPTIKAISSTGHSKAYATMSAYCEPPQITVTDADNDLKSVSIKNGSQPENVFFCDDKSVFTHQLEVIGVAGYVVTITAEDEAGNKEVLQLMVSHTLGGRDYVKYEATCAEPAKTVSSYLCAVCGELYNVQTSYEAGSVALEHRYGETQTKGLSECGGSGTVTTMTCLDCGYVKITYSEDYVLGDAHVYIQVAKNPTCTQGVYCYEQCSVCGVIKGEQTLIKSTGHNFGDWETIQESDCSKGQQKIEERKCQNNDCDVNETRKTNATHKWASGVILQEATCTEVGYKGSKCLVCDVWAETKTEIPALGHIYSDDNDCTTQSKCSRCGNIVPGIEHNLGEYKSDGTGHWRKCQNSGCNYSEKSEEHVRPENAVDCTNSWVCEVCNYVIPPASTAHSWGAWQSDDNFHWQECTNPNCTQTTAKAAHTGDDGDCTTEHKCTTCQKVIAEAKTHNYSSSYTYNVDNHYKACTNPGCKKTTAREEHTYSSYANAHDCTKNVTCDTCGYIASYGAKTHKFTNSPWYADESGNGHYKVCQNGNCNVKSAVESHSGGAATCKDLAICDTCRSSYGNLDTSNHVGGTELQNVLAATETREGYTGDEICLGCGKIVKKGETIPKIQSEHVHGFVEQKDDTASWEQCECGEIRNKVSHTYNEWKSDGENHWQVCTTCGYETSHSPHALNENEIDKDCTTAVHCMDCDYVIIEAMTHKFSTEYVYDEDGHWNVCTNPDCEQISDVENHAPDDNADCTSAVVCKDCGHTLTAGMNSHNWSSVWESDADGHYHSCLNIGCEQINREKHIAVDDGICTTPIVCAVCGYEIEAGLSVHDFSGTYITTSTGHYQLCQNEGCNEHSAETPHSGGTATCKSPAICQVCAVAYGDIDPNNHTGNMELVGHIEPTVELEGYTGDYVCADCGEILETGTILDKIPEEHEHVFDIEDFVPEYYLSDDVNHWYECYCGAISIPEQHEFEDDAWESDNNGHWHFCTVCGKAVMEAHSFDENGQCTVCGFEMSVHEHSYVWKYDETNHWQECTSCGETIDNDVHSGGEATCVDLAVCDVCGGSYGVLDSANHIATEVRDKKDATETEDGYTGDTYCTGCGKLIEKGTVIPSVTPEPTPTPEPTETSTPTPEPTDTPEATPEPTPEPTDTPEATPEPTDTPEATPEPTDTPEATPEPTDTPEPTPEPTDTPEPTPEPTDTPEPTPEPTDTPEATPEPTDTPEPTPEPTDTPEPTPEPTDTPEPTPEPTDTPTLTGAPNGNAEDLPNTPNTSDNTSLGILILLMIMSGSTLVMISLYGRERFGR